MGSPWKAMADDSRREILLMLRKKEMTPSQISKHFEFSFPAVSTHLKILKDADLIKEEKLGKNRFYSLNNAKSIEILKFFESMWGYNLKSLKEYLENKEKKIARK